MEKLIKIIVPKSILNKIDGDLFEDLCKDIALVGNYEDEESCN